MEDSFLNPNPAVVVVVVINLVVVLTVGFMKRHLMKLWKGGLEFSEIGALADIREHTNVLPQPCIRRIDGDH